MTKIHEVWVDTGESIVRNATIGEEELFDAVRQEQQSHRDRATEQAVAAASARAKLAALGLTDDEINALLGV